MSGVEVSVSSGVGVSPSWAKAIWGLPKPNTDKTKQAKTNTEIAFFWRVNATALFM
jgi:hypothetical protein